MAAAAVAVKTASPEEILIVNVDLSFPGVGIAL